LVDGLLLAPNNLLSLWATTSRLNAILIMLFATAPIAGIVWLLVIPCALGILVLEELRELLARRHRPRAA
jgi:hypothetical protein